MGDVLEVTIHSDGFPVQIDGDVLKAEDRSDSRLFFRTGGEFCVPDP